MKILLTNATDIFAGGEDYVLILGKYLRHRGHSVTVSALPGHLLLEKCRAADIATLPLEYRTMSHVFQVGNEIRRFCREERIEIIHSNANYDRTAAALGATGSRACHIAGVHSTHSIQHNVTHWLRNRYGIAHFITDADAGRDVLIQEDHIAPSRITTVPIGIEDDPPAFMASARERTRGALGIAPDTTVIGNVARLVPFKGHSVLLAAAASVLAVRPGVVFLIIGDGELQPQLEAQARSLGITESVRFLGFRDNLQEWYPAFDIYCHSSLELAAEMFPIAILRALAAGLPVVCTQVGGIAAMVREGESGYLVPPERPDLLSERLLRVVDDRDARRCLGQHSHELFLHHYHAGRMAEAVERVYLTALA